MIREHLHERPIRSLIAVVATTTAAGSVYVGRGLANMRIAMALEVTTTIGGILGGILFRVLALVGVWWRERDYRFVGVALIVVTTLIASVLLGRGG